MTSGEERLQDLLVKRTLEGIDLDEAREMATLSQLYPDVDTDQFDETVALLDAVPLGGEPPLPASVVRSVMARVAPAQPEPVRASAPSAWPWVAVAATALIAVVGWWQVLTGPSAPPRQAVEATAPDTDEGPEPSTAPINDFQLVDEAADTISVAWSGSQDPGRPSLRGVVRWSAASQLGYMELDGLPRNDPDVEQYQLWIFDATRPDAFPVDGGVFDISIDGPNLIPIRAALPVRQAALFAVTVEAPGGVVVSGREQLVALAEVP